ncbi:hypothetical protein [Actinobaculum sp. 313]|uniref:hypothetical protein n=1 Tax=Actinobaculum sp. 313 TaxID=2495645 RepID=UPI000D5280FE|nr:hypothetical protein [Actinobaculum sp. 313]AWE42384.1 hypothetical protein DDD63_06070 [Actinobaculum sp. 313]
MGLLQLKVDVGDGIGHRPGDLALRDGDRQQRALFLRRWHGAEPGEFGQPRQCLQGIKARLAADRFG